MTAGLTGPPERADVQGWIVHGYHLGHARHLVVEIRDGKAFRRLLGASTGGDPDVPQVTSAEPWPDGHKPPACLNLGLTWAGLHAAGASRTTLDSFPRDYREGAAVRAAHIGDVGDSGVDAWDDALRDPSRVHAVVTIHGQSFDAIDAMATSWLDAAGSAVDVVGAYQGEEFPEGRVHFGYVDGIAQPQIAGLHDPDDRRDGQPPTPPGSFFLGRPTSFEDLVYTVPQPAVFGLDGTYNAFRVLEQDVVAFEAWLHEAADLDPRLDPELVAAKAVGRWRSGVPLTLSPSTGEPDSVPRPAWNDYDYTDDDGAVCPLGSHMRRANPRNTRIVQRGSNHTRRIIRRGIPYGPEWRHGDPVDDEPRGLLGNFLCGSLSAQFEAVMYDWINLGLQHPDITGTNDPILGANEATTSRFEIPMGDGSRLEVCGFGRFIRTRGCAYTFLPSLPALRWLASA